MKLAIILAATAALLTTTAHAQKVGHDSARTQARWNNTELQNCVMRTAYANEDVTIASLLRGDKVGLGIEDSILIGFEIAFTE